jgi:hypothetical protein
MLFLKRLKNVMVFKNKNLCDLFSATMLVMIACNVIKEDYQYHANCSLYLSDMQHL